MTEQKETFESRARLFFQPDTIARAESLGGGKLTPKSLYAALNASYKEMGINCKALMKLKIGTKFLEDTDFELEG